MNKKPLKELLLLLGLVIVTALIARNMAKGETLEEYAKSNADAAQVASTEMATGSAIAANDMAVNEPSNEAPVASTEAPEDADGMTKAASDNQTDSTKTNTKDNSASNADKETEDTSHKVDSAIENNENAPTQRITYMDGFYSEPISNEVFKRISGISYPVDCTVSLDELNYLSLKYVDFNGEVQTGEMICHKDLSQDLLEIFYELYTSSYQIESIKLIDEFNGDDTASMKANNTSCFNYRVVEGSTRLSNHAYGRAVDLNPFYNPYITYNKDGSINISPEGSEAYADRSSSFPYKIDENDLAYKLFKEHGFKWGGDWNSVKDYQHFEKKAD